MARFRQEQGRHLWPSLLPPQPQPTDSSTHHELQLFAPIATNEGRGHRELALKSEEVVGRGVIDLLLDMRAEGQATELLGGVGSMGF